MKLSGKEMELKYGINSIRALIRETGKTPMQIMNDGFDPSDFELGITLIWAGLLWTNRKITPDVVGQWFDAEPEAYVPAITEAVQVFMSAFTRSLGVKPDEEEADEDPEAKN
jgi:hypothetical protein